MIDKIKSTLRNKFVRNILLVASGTAGAQALTMLFSPVITRLYGPEAFGLMGAFQAVLGVVTPIAALTYPIAIVLPKSDDDARGIAKLSFLLALVMAGLLMLVTLIANQSIAELLNVQAIAGFLWLIPIAMLLSAMQQIMQQWLIRKNQFKVTARIAVSQSLILNTTKTGAGWFYSSGIMLIILATLGNALYAVQLWFGSKQWSGVEERINTPFKTKPNLKELAYTHRDFPYYRAPQVFLNSISQSFPTLLLVAVFNPTIAGFFTLSNTVLAAPANLIGGSVSNVFYPKITQKVNDGEDPTNLLIKATLGVLSVVSIPLSVVLFLGPWLFELVFGDQWGDAGSFAQWMTGWLVVSVAARPTIAIIPVMKLQGFFLSYEVVFTILKIGSLLVGGMYYKSPLVAVASYSVVSALFYILLFMNVLYVIRRKKF